MDEGQKQIKPSKVVFARSSLTQMPTQLTAKRPTPMVTTETYPLEMHDKGQ
jgi:hypothetical protein